MIKCKYCQKEIEGKSNKKFCSDHCRSMNWKSMKSLKKLKKETKHLLDKASVTVSPEVQELYNRIFKN